MRSIRVKADRLKMSGILFMLSGVVWFLAAALGRPLVFIGLGGLYLCVGAVFIARWKKSAAS